MKAVIQRVSRAHITIDGVGERAIGPGLVILLGVKDTDPRHVRQTGAEVRGPAHF